MECITLHELSVFFINNDFIEREEGTKTKRPEGLYRKFQYYIGPHYTWQLNPPFSYFVHKPILGPWDMNQYNIQGIHQIFDFMDKM